MFCSDFRRLCNTRFKEITAQMAYLLFTEGSCDLSWFFLLKWNSHNIQLITLNVQFSIILCIHSVVQPLPLCQFKIISPQKNNPYPLNIHSSFTLLYIPWQPVISFLSLWICLFWMFHIKGTINYVTFSLAYFTQLMLSKFIQVS